MGINIKTVSTMDCDIQPSTNLSMKDKKILNHDTDVNLTASQVIPVDALNIKHQNKRSLQSKNIIPPSKQLLQQNAIQSKLAVTANSNLQKGKRQFFANESIVPTGTGWSDSFQPFPSKPFFAAQSLPYMEDFLLGICPINTMSHQPIHVLKNEREIIKKRLLVIILLWPTGIRNVLKT